MKVGVVGPYTWFSPHFPEGWDSDPDTLCLDVDESDYRFLINMINFRPDVTLFYRPELYPARFLHQIHGLKIGFLSEPVPRISNGEFIRSSETDLRLAVYGNMNWSCYDMFFYYDKTKESAIRKLGWPISDFRPMPIDVSLFNAAASPERPIDVFFIGKPTPHRIWQLDFLRTMKVNYRWIAHGLTGPDLAQAFRASKVVLNIHADGLPAIEPRVHLAAACGCVVLSEETDGDLSPFAERVYEFSGKLNADHVRQALAASQRIDVGSVDENELSARRFIEKCLNLRWNAGNAQIVA